jgi:pimeloyl-ACP methyl ester carboxylesterase
VKARLRDIEVTYAVHGEGPPVVFVHGLAEDRRSWADVQSRLDDHRTFAYDLRGHGGTSLGAADGTLDQLGGDLIAFLENVTGPAACVGYSLGGTVVLWVAATRPELITRAVVSGTSAVVGSAAVGFFEERIKTIESDFPSFAAALREDTKAQLIVAQADLDEIAARRLDAIGGGEGYVNAARAMARLHDEPLTPLLSKIRCPVDVVGGDGDLFCPRKAADIIVDALEDGVYREIANAGHLMSVDQPAAYGDVIRAALERETT